MGNTKCLYVDIYKTNFSEDGVTVTDNKHLINMDINIDVSVREVVIELRQLIFRRYGDGLSIKAEEFDSFCYLNVFVFFGEDISTLIEYLDSISIEKIVSKVEGSLSEEDEDVTFLSIDFVESEEIKEYELLMESLGLNPKQYLLGQSAFERGAGDYHQVLVFILDALAMGALTEVGKRSLEKFLNQFGDYQIPLIGKFNYKTAINYVSKISGINKQDLRLTRNLPINDTQSEIKVTSRYKDYLMTYDKESKSFIQYEEIDKTQTMI